MGKVNSFGRAVAASNGDSESDQPVADDTSGRNGPARNLLATLGSRFERKAKEQKLPVPAVLDRDSSALQILRSYEESGQGWFWSTDADGRLTYLTEKVMATLGGDRGSPIGQDFADLFMPGEDAAGNRRTLGYTLARRSKFAKIAMASARSTDGQWWELSGSPQKNAHGEFCGFLGGGVDITEQRRSSEAASQLAMFDPLTGLSNRRRMAQVLDSTLRAFGQQNRSCGVMLIDLDRFKQVNDTLGHPAGDALLKQVAQRLLKLVNDREKVCRLGGDEFQITLADMDDRGAVGDLAQDIISSLSQPYSVEGARCVIGASIGIAISPFDGTTSEEVIRNADLALYAAKGGGRGRFRFFTSDFLKAAEDKRVLEEDLRDAVAKGEMALAYQPIVSIKGEAVTGVEALLRWNHPERGPISPAIFIPIAEEANLIESIGEWALRQACSDAATWPGKMRVAVNVSPIQFANEGFPKIVKSALQAAKLQPGRLELEITEGVFLSDSNETDTMFVALKELGVRLALDDFGTGYSSLGYLRKAPFDKIKIDQSFVRDAAEPGSRSAAIIAAIVALANALDMETTAEGIETLDQLDLLRKLRVSHIQGYVYSKPVSNADLGEALGHGAEWHLTPSGPAKQRTERLSVFRRAGVIHGDHWYPVIVRNISTTGALIEGIIDIPVGTQLVLDFGEGQLAVATVRRSEDFQQGVEFETTLVNDGNGGYCTRHRVSPYLLSLAGLPGNVSDPKLKGATATARMARLEPAFRTINDSKIIQVRGSLAA